MHFLSPFIRLVCCLAIVISLTSCEAFKPKKVNTREVPINAQEAARKNVEEGKGISVKVCWGVDVEEILNLVLQIQCGGLH